MVDELVDGLAYATRSPTSRTAIIRRRQTSPIIMSEFYHDKISLYHAGRESFEAAFARVTSSGATADGFVVDCESRVGGEIGSPTLGDARGSPVCCCGISC